MHEKYASDAGAAAGDAPIEISGKVVEEVGFAKVRAQQAALRELRIVLVDGQRIAGLCEHPWDGEPRGDAWEQELRRIANICPSIVELDLSRSLLERWADVAGICSALPSLRRLVLEYLSLPKCHRLMLRPSAVAIAFVI